MNQPVTHAVEPRSPLLEVFRRAAARVPAYRQILREAGVDPDHIDSEREFRLRCPSLDKTSTFGRFALSELCVDGTLEGIQSVVTSSGHSGRFAFGLSSTRHAEAFADFVDERLDRRYGVRSRSTLLINTLPMGVRLASRATTLAETSVREDMALAVARELGPRFEQIILVADPLFLKRLMDASKQQGFDWSSMSVHVLVGEETFPESYRDYVAAHFGFDPSGSTEGSMRASMGVGELGLDLLFETPDTVALRRRARTSSDVRAQVLGMPYRDGPTGALPIPHVFSWDPERMDVEVLDAGPNGWGELAISLLDATAPVPLLRYRTGDAARLIRPAEGTGELRVAVMGRRTDVLPGGHVLQYKEALYRDPELARHLTGAFRAETGETPRNPWGDSPTPVVHVQLAAGAVPWGALEQRVRSSLQRAGVEATPRLWPYRRYPYGMGLDYERKHSHG